MTSKIKILHIIDSLEKGGAEKLLVDCMSEIQKAHPEAEQYLWTLHTYQDEFSIPKNIKRISRNISMINFFSTIRAVNKFITENKITVIHAHLIDSILVSRFLKSNSIRKKVFTYHNFYYSSNFVYYSWWRTLVEKITYKKKYTSIFVSKEIKTTTEVVRGRNPNDLVLDNFFNPAFKYQYKVDASVNTLKMVIVANLRETKNLFLAVKEMALLKNYPVSLDIYGEGNLREELQKEINKEGVAITLKGRQLITPELLSNYDIFLLTSISEGLPIALLEAMATGLPSLLPDHLPMFKEVAANSSICYSIKKEGELSEKIKFILNNKTELIKLSEDTKVRIKNYQATEYINVLLQTYYSPRILYLIDNLNIGGAEELLVNTANELAKNDQYIVHVGTTKAPNGPLHKHLLPKVNYIHFNCRRLTYLFGIIKLRKYIRDNNINIVHGHLESSIIVSRIGCNKKTKLVATYHNMEFSKESVYYGYRKVFFERLTYNKNSFSIYVSKNVQALVESIRPSNPGYCEVLNNFSVKTTNGNYKPNPAGGLRLVTIANIKASKNIPFILEVMVDLKDYSIYWDIYGDGVLKPKFENEITRLNINVRLLGSQPISNDLFYSYDLFALTSLSEGMPLALLEALGYGMPSLLPDHMPIMKEIAGDSAFYFSIHDKDRFKKKLIDLLENKEALPKMSAVAISQNSLFSMKNHIDKLNGIYEKIILS
jgi:glycosyltransferase involved in cell wall biosynthesis